MGSVIALDGATTYSAPASRGGTLALDGRISVRTFPAEGGERPATAGEVERYLRLMGKSG